MKSLEYHLVFDKVNKKVINTSSGMTLCSIFKRWNNLTTRVYREYHPEKTSSYCNVEVGEDFLNFATFKDWFIGDKFSSFYASGAPYSIDKDLLGDGKLYSKDTCCFIPAWLNNMIPSLNTNLDKKLMYVSVKRKGENSTTYTAYLKREDGKGMFVGGFKCPVEANKFAIFVKGKVIMMLADNLVGFVEDRVIERMSNIGEWLNENGYNFDPKYQHKRLDATLKFYFEYYLGVLNKYKSCTEIIPHESSCEYCKRTDVDLSWIVSELAEGV